MHIQSIYALGAEAVKFLYRSPEDKEGKQAFLERIDADGDERAAEKRREIERGSKTMPKGY